MAGIYLHIPFCKQACHYCNFHFTTSLTHKDELLKALVAETEAEKRYLTGETVHTIYFGGGTPSLLTLEDCEQLLSAINKNYDVDADAEITLEANPDDITSEKLNGWKKMGINRLSIGVQSFFEEELRWMNRAHNARQAIDNLALARTYFGNITMDLIYGSPLLSDEMWRENVEIATGLDIPHLSCYALTVEEKTPLHKMIRLEKTNNVDSDKQARQFLLLMKWLKEKGYEHYEVSNFAKPGYRSRHNSSYWKGEKYLGLGPSAHSFNGDERRWNIANNQLYIKAINAGNTARESEQLTEIQKLNEYVMISLRTIEGIDLSVIELRWGTHQKIRMEDQLKKHFINGLLMKKDSCFLLTDEGMLIADGMAADLFSTE